MGGADLSNVIASHQEVQGVLFSSDAVDGQIAKVQVLFLVLLHRDAGPLVKRLLRVLFLEEIVALLVVNFEVGSENLVFKFMFFCLYLTEKQAKGAWDDAAVSPCGTVATHCVGFTTTGLTVSKNRAVVTLQEICDEWCCDFVENIFLTCCLFKNFPKIETVTRFLIAHRRLGLQSCPSNLERVKASLLCARM